VPIVAIVGRPNVGKSTLFNRLTGKRKAIVDNLPGVSRDRNYGTVTWEQKSFTLIDTGGFEAYPQEPISSKIREQVQLAIEEADAIVFLSDGKDGLLPPDKDIVKLLKACGKKVFYSVNKMEGEKDHANLPDFYQLGVEPLYPISAQHGSGVTELLNDLADFLPGEPAEADAQTTTRLAIVGRPNVGKSSLINRILGYKRLIVSEIPGTTRDSIDTPIRYFGEQYLLIDTAGIRKKSRVSLRVERYSMVEALKSIERCDLGVLLIDSTQGVTEQDARIGGYLYEQGKGTIIAVNKWDLIEKDTSSMEKYTEEIRHHLPFLDFAPIIFVSALTGQRVSQILRLIQEVSHDYRKRLLTSELNRALTMTTGKHPLPFYRKRPLKLYYMTQISTAPPAFVIFTNHPEAIHFSYERYLINQLRENFGFSGVPLRLMLRERKRKPAIRNKKGLGFRQ
jgi:GTP-binding protein